jgi:hypothetical protein
MGFQTYHMHEDQIQYIKILVLNKILQLRFLQTLKFLNMNNLHDSSSELWGVSETENYLGINSPYPQKMYFELLISIDY